MIIVKARAASIHRWTGIYTSDHNQAKPHVQAMRLIKSQEPNEWKKSIKREKKSKMRRALEPTLFERH